MSIGNDSLIYYCYLNLSLLYCLWDGITRSESHNFRVNLIGFTEKQINFSKTMFL